MDQSDDPGGSGDPEQPADQKTRSGKREQPGQQGVGGRAVDRIEIAVDELTGQHPHGSAVKDPFVENVGAPVHRQEERKCREREHCAAA